MLWGQKQVPSKDIWYSLHIGANMFRVFGEGDSNWRYHFRVVWERPQQQWNKAAIQLGCQYLWGRCRQDVESWKSLKWDIYLRGLWILSLWMPVPRSEDGFPKEIIALKHITFINSPHFQPYDPAQNDLPSFQLRHFAFLHYLPPSQKFKSIRLSYLN
mgnify:CR=1 FL=1